MSLKKLLDIRTKRKERVFLELSIANDVVVARKIDLNNANNYLIHFRDWRVKEQKSLFDTLTSKQFTPKEYEKYMAKLTKIDAQEHQLIEQIKLAESAVQDAEKNYQKIKTKSLAVTRELEKLTEILEGEEKDEKIMKLRKEEREAEDFMPSLRSF